MKQFISILSFALLSSIFSLASGQESSVGSTASGNTATSCSNAYPLFQHRMLSLSGQFVTPSLSSSSKEYRGGTSAGYGGLIAYDIFNTKDWGIFEGLYFSYDRIGIHHIGIGNKAASLYSGGVRFGYKSRERNSFSVSLAAMMGTSFVQTLHKVDSHYVHTSPALTAGMEGKFYYRLSQKFSLSLGWTLTALGDRTFRSGSNLAVGNQSVIINPYYIGLGATVHL